MTDSARGAAPAPSRITVVAIGVALLLVLSAPDLNAQATGVIAGSVLNTAGRPIAGAQVRLDGLARHAVTENDGTFFLRGLERATYSVRVRVIGYNQAERAVNVDKDLVRVTISLDPIPQVLDSVLVMERRAGPGRRDPVRSSRSPGGFVIWMRNDVRRLRGERGGRGESRRKRREADGRGREED